MSDYPQERVLALAGLFQAAQLTQQLAREGRTNKEALHASLQSLFRIDAASTAEVFGGIGGVETGLMLLRDRLGATSNPLDYELARYVVNLMQVERALERNPAVLESIGEGLKTIESQMKFFASEEKGETDEAHPRLAEKLGELYTQTVSLLTPRILVNGEHGHLSNPLIAAKVRAALFAGVRAAYLWRQLGGSRWHLLFYRRRIINTAGYLLELARAH